MPSQKILRNLFHLELDGALQLLDLGRDVVAMIEWRREFASLVETTTKHLLQLLDDSVRGEESIVRVRQLLHLLVLLVELFKVIERHTRNIVGLGLITMLLITKHAHSKLWLRHVLEPYILLYFKETSFKTY